MNCIELNGEMEVLGNIQKDMPSFLKEDEFESKVCAGKKS